MNFRTEPLYKNEKGYDVWVEGPVIIQGIEHYVIDGYVSCDRSLNNRAWNITEKISKCEICFGLERRQAETVPEYLPGKQLNMFD